MSHLRRGFQRKSKDAAKYLIALFLIFPGAILVVGLTSQVPLALIGGLITVYYLVAALVVAVQGFEWLEALLS